MLCLAVPASAEYMYHGYEFNPDNPNSVYFSQVGQGNTQNDMSTAKYYNMSNSNLFLIAYYILRNLDGKSIQKYLYDQKNDVSFYPVQYLAYALHGLKGTITSSGTIIASNNLGSDSKDYFLTRWANMNSNATITDANRWRVQTLSDNSQYSWLYQVASGAGSMQLLTDALMNWSNPSFGMYSPADTANYSWFNQVLQAVNNSKADVSDLAKESTLYAVYSSGKTLNTKVDTLNGKVATETTLSKLYNTFTINRAYGSINSFGDGKGNTTIQASKVTQSSYPKGVLDSLYSLMVGEVALNNNLLHLDEILSTKNDRALKTATDGFKPDVTNYVSDKGTNYGDSFTIGDTISSGLKPDLSTSDASSAIGGLFSPDSGDYWGWFSSETDSDLHPSASGVSTLSLDDEPSSQDIADSETVWVINPYASSSDLVSDFFGGE